MDEAAEVARAAQSRMLIVLQPSLAEKTYPTSIEKVLLETSFAPYQSPGDLRAGYEAIRNALQKRKEAGKLDWLDASRLFNGETATSFSDLWHFPDPGHELLGRALAEKLAAVLARR
jgi:hypothetical protein